MVWTNWGFSRGGGLRYGGGAHRPRAARQHARAERAGRARGPGPRERARVRRPTADRGRVRCRGCVSSWKSRLSLNSAAVPGRPAWAMSVSS